MNSRLYRCQVMHKRDRPKLHRFNYQCFIFCIDLDEVDQLSRTLPLFGYNSRRPYSLRDEDHLQEGGTSIKDNVLRYLKSAGVEAEIGRIELVSNLRTWGHIFNPVSFYFVYLKDGSLCCCLAEVANTFNEQKLYLVDQRSDKSERLQQSHLKNFYISPFSEPDTFLHFNLAQPESRIRLSITESDANGTYFSSSLTGEVRPLNNGELIRQSLRFPAMTLKVVAAIHWQALRLYLKRVPYFSKSHRPSAQTETRVYLKRKKRHRQTA